MATHGYNGYIRVEGSVNCRWVVFNNINYVQPYLSCGDSTRLSPVSYPVFEATIDSSIVYIFRCEDNRLYYRAIIVSDENSNSPFSVPEPHSEPPSPRSHQPSQPLANDEVPSPRGYSVPAPDDIDEPSIVKQVTVSSYVQHTAFSPSLAYSYKYLCARHFDPSLRLDQDGKRRQVANDCRLPSPNFNMSSFLSLATPYALAPSNPRGAEQEQTIFHIAVRLNSLDAIKWIYVHISQLIRLEAFASVAQFVEQVKDNLSRFVPEPFDPFGGLPTSLLNSYDTRGYTALHEACEQGHLEIVEWLVRHGADPTIQSQPMDFEGGPPALNTPMHMAAEHGHLAIIQWLVLSASFSALLVNGQMQTLLMVAVMKGRHDVFQWLLPGFDSAMTDQQGRSVLHHAALCNRLSMIETICNRPDVDINAQDKEGKTPLYLAIIAYGNRRTATPCEDPPPPSHFYSGPTLSPTHAIAVLLQKGAKTEIADLHGVTPIVYARAKGYGEVEALLAHSLHAAQVAPPAAATGPVVLPGGQQVIKGTKKNIAPRPGA